MDNLAVIYKKTKTGFVRCRMSELRRGDKFIYEGTESPIRFIATSNPYRNHSEIWSIKCEKV